VPVPTDPPIRRRLPQRRALAWAIACACTAALPGIAHTTPQSTNAVRWPDAADMERARIARPMPPDTSTPAPSSGVPRVEALPSPLRPTESSHPSAKVLGSTGIDIEALARQGQALGSSGGAAGSASQPSGLRVFVTLDMPQGSLERLVTQAERHGATLVLRGLKDQSMRLTLERVQALLGQRPVAWQIDPGAFEHYRVQAAPTFVLDLPHTDPGGHAQCTGGGCTERAPFVSVSGDVSLDYALQAMALRQPLAAPRALQHLGRQGVRP
jgi:conjugal transfer pilus assembly protein TrbC